MIIVRLEGGLGNQMFQYALGRMLALKNNTDLKLDLALLRDRTPRRTQSNFVFRNYDLDIFAIKAQIARRSHLPFRYRFYLFGRFKHRLDALRRRYIHNPASEKAFCSFDPSILSIGPDAYLEGYWQSPKYFKDIDDVIRNDFKLKGPLSEKSQKLMEEIGSCASLCVNVRRGDFVTSDFHGTFGKDYYDRGIERILKTQRIEKIYIFSDDVSWCREHLRFPFPTVVVDHEYAGEKFGEYLALMSACKHFIIPNSSFAWWAAWLSTDREKLVIAPNQWFLDTSIDTSDLIPENWERI
jgi:hypothetical protein